MILIELSTVEKLYTGLGVVLYFYIRHGMVLVYFFAFSLGAKLSESQKVLIHAVSTATRDQQQQQLRSAARLAQ